MEAGNQDTASIPPKNEYLLANCESNQHNVQIKQYANLNPEHLVPPVGDCSQSSDY